MLERSLGLPPRTFIAVLSSESQKLSMEVGVSTSCQMVEEEKKRNRTWCNYNNSLYRIILEFLLN